MKIRVGKENIRLDRNEVKEARRLTNEIIENISRISKNSKRPSFFFTFLIYIHVYTGQMIKDMDPENIRKVMDFLKDEKQKEN